MSACSVSDQELSYPFTYQCFGRQPCRFARTNNEDRASLKGTKSLIGKFHSCQADGSCTVMDRGRCIRCLSDLKSSLKELVDDLSRKICFSSDLVCSSKLSEDL